MLQARRLDGYDDDATVDGAALLHDESEKPLLTSMMHLGRWPLEVAPTVCVQLFEKQRIRCWRADSVEGLAPRPDGEMEADGVITATKIEKSRVDRAYSVSDVTLHVAGAAQPLKLWLPRRVCLRRRWEALLRNDIFSRSKKRLAIEQRVASAAEAFATGGPPPGHTRHRDAETGRDYGFSSNRPRFCKSILRCRRWKPMHSFVWSVPRTRCKALQDAFYASEERAPHDEPSFFAQLPRRSRSLSAAKDPPEGPYGSSSTACTDFRASLLQRRVATLGPAS